MLTFSSLEGKKRDSQPGKKTVNFFLHTKCLHYKRKIPRYKTAKMLTVGSVHFMNQLHQMFWRHGFFSANTGNPKETNQILSFVVFVTFSGAELKRQNSELCNQTSGFVHIYSEAGKRGFQVQVQTWEKGNTRSHSTMHSPNPDSTQSTPTVDSHSRSTGKGPGKTGSDPRKSIQGRWRQTSEKHSGTQGEQQETKPGYTNT